MSDILDLPEGARRPQHPWKENMVNDPEAPRMFSPQAIFLFSMIYTVLAGAVLLAVNARLLKARLWIMAYGIAGGALPISLMFFFPSLGILYFPLNALLCFGLVPFLWNKGIGAHTKFRARPVWLPVLILIILPMLYFFGIIDLLLFELGYYKY